MTGTGAAGYLTHNWRWIRDGGNPVLPPGPPGSADEAVCMNPWAVVEEGAFRLYYAGGRADGTKRICLATAPVDDPRTWTRHGPLFEIGGPRSFDARWCVLPHVVRVASDR